MRLSARGYLILAAAASAAMLAAAHAFERLGGYAPCPLCLRQREVYWIGLAAAGLGVALLSRRAEPHARTTLPLLLGAVFLTGGAIAGYHAGVEWKWFPAPLSCGGAGGSASAADLADLLAGEGARFVRCDEAAWRLFGLSMAGWNLLISLGLATLGLAAAFAAPAAARGVAHA